MVYSIAAKIRLNNPHRLAECVKLKSKFSFVKLMHSFFLGLYLTWGHVAVADMTPGMTQGVTTGLLAMYMDLANLTCRICGQQFKKAYNLKRHIPTHTGGKNFQCPTCFKVFTRKDNMMAHSTKCQAAHVPNIVIDLL